MIFEASVLPAPDSPLKTKSKTKESVIRLSEAIESCAMNKERWEMDKGEIENYCCMCIIASTCTAATSNTQRSIIFEVSVLSEPDFHCHMNHSKNNSSTGIEKRERERLKTDGFFSLPGGCGLGGGLCIVGYKSPRGWRRESMLYCRSVDLSTVKENIPDDNGLRDTVLAYAT